MTARDLNAAAMDRTFTETPDAGPSPADRVMRRKRVMSEQIDKLALTATSEGADLFDRMGEHVAEVLTLDNTKRATALAAIGKAASASPTQNTAEKPTADNPLRGLRHLGKVALIGRDRIIAKAREPINYVWQDIAVSGTIVLLAGGPSEGKTTLLFLLLAARATVGPPVELLGRELTPAPEGQWVVLIEGEHMEGSTCRKLLRSCELVDVSDHALDRVIIVARKAVRLGSPEWSDVVKLTAEGLVSDIAIDTIARVAPADADNEREQVAIFDQVAQAIEAAPIGKAPTIWACAHTRKSRSGGLEDVAGSAQRVGQADSVLMVAGEKVNGKTVSSTITFAKLREEPDVYPDPVTFAIVADGGQRSIRTTAGARPARPTTGADERPLETRIEEQLAGGPMTNNQLRIALGRNMDDLKEPISNLFSAKAIERVDVKKNGREWSALQLRRSTGRAPDPGLLRRAPDEHRTSTGR